MEAFSKRKGWENARVLSSVEVEGLQWKEDELKSSMKALPGKALLIVAPLTVMISQ